MPDRLSTIGSGLRVDGHLVGDGSVEVRGHFEGSVHIGGDLLVAHGAVVRADVLAARVQVDGQLVGTVRATHAIRVGPTGELQGTVEGPLSVDDGGVYRGRMTPGRVRPQKTVNTRRRRPPPPPRPPADQETAGMPAVPAPPVTASTSLSGSGEFEPPSNPEEGWFGAPAPQRRASSELPITEGEPPPWSVSGMPALSEDQVAVRLSEKLAALAGPVTGEMPPSQDDSLDDSSDDALGDTINDIEESTDPLEAPDPRMLVEEPQRLRATEPPRRRTTSPGVAPFRQSFGGGLPAVPIPRSAPRRPTPAHVSGRAIPAVRIKPADPPPSPPAEPRRPRPQSSPGVPPDQDPDLSDSWFLNEDEELEYP